MTLGSLKGGQTHEQLHPAGHGHILEKGYIRGSGTTVGRSGRAS